MRTFLTLLCLWHGGNGLWMLLAPADWFMRVPGVRGTGPENAHLIRDVGLGFLAAAAALGLAVLTPAMRRVLVAVALVFVGGHGALHLLEMLSGPEGAARDGVLILLPAFLPLAVYLKGARR